MQFDAIINEYPYKCNSNYDMRSYWDAFLVAKWNHYLCGFSNYAMHQGPQAVLGIPSTWSRHPGSSQSRPQHDHTPPFRADAVGGLVFWPGWKAGSSMHCRCPGCAFRCTATAAASWKMSCTLAPRRHVNSGPVTPSNIPFDAICECLGGILNAFS